TDSGRSLSGGQRQRIALARSPAPPSPRGIPPRPSPGGAAARRGPSSQTRAPAAPAPVLVLHEPTTALDAATEVRIAGALRAARDGRTTLLVTTSPTLLAACDTVTVVRD